AVAVARQLRPDGSKQVRVECQSERQSLVVIEAGRDQLGQAYGGQQAASDACGETGAGAGHDRQVRPESVACRRMRIVRQRVEEKTGKAMPRQMILDLEA